MIVTIINIYMCLYRCINVNTYKCNMFIYYAYICLDINIH